jgi:hypothetical protein
MSINQQPAAQVWQWKLKKFIAHRSDQFFEEAVNMAEKATSLTPAQISKLQMIAYSASKFSDLLDYIKLQTGRRKEWREKEFGKSLLQVAVELGGEADKAIQDCNVPAEFAESEKIRTKIILAREYIKHIVAHYHY